LCPSPVLGKVFREDEFFSTCWTVWLACEEFFLLVFDWRLGRREVGFAKGFKMKEVTSNSGGWSSSLLFWYTVVQRQFSRL